VLWGAYQFYQFDFNPITIIGVFKPFYYSSTYVGAVAALFTGYFLGKGPRVGASLMLVLLATGIVIFTESRAALLSLLLLLFTWGLMQLSRPLRLVLPAAGVVVFLSFGGLEKLQTSFRYNKVESHDPNSNVFEETLSVTNVETDVSNKERLNRWVSALKMFSVQPHFGFGPGTYQFQYIPFQEASLKNRLSVRNPDDIPQGSGGTAHSELLLQLSENGWPSVVVFIAMLVFWVRRGIWQVGLSKNVAPYFLGLSTYLFHMNVNNFLNQPGFAFLFWTFGAMLMQGGDE
jgi:O-antigen ligase